VNLLSDCFLNPRARKITFLRVRRIPRAAGIFSPYFIISSALDFEKEAAGQA
jgi:hypothetical protein